VPAKATQPGGHPSLGVLAGPVAPPQGQRPDREPDEFERDHGDDGARAIPAGTMMASVPITSAAHTMMMLTCWKAFSISPASEAGTESRACSPMRSAGRPASERGKRRASSS
jgi:hypothetical protein